MRLSSYNARPATTIHNEINFLLLVISGLTRETQRVRFQQSTRHFPIPLLSNVEGLLPKSILGDLFRNHYQTAVVANGFHSITILMKSGF